MNEAICTILSISRNSMNRFFCWSTFVRTLALMFQSFSFRQWVHTSNKVNGAIRRWFSFLVFILLRESNSQSSKSKSRRFFSFVFVSWYRINDYIMESFTESCCFALFASYFHWVAKIWWWLCRAYQNHIIRSHSFSSSSSSSSIHLSVG